MGIGAAGRPLKGAQCLAVLLQLDARVYVRQLKRMKALPKPVKACNLNARVCVCVCVCMCGEGGTSYLLAQLQDNAHTELAVRAAQDQQSG